MNKVIEFNSEYHRNSVYESNFIDYKKNTLTKICWFLYLMRWFNSMHYYLVKKLLPQSTLN